MRDNSKRYIIIDQYEDEDFENEGYEDIRRYLISLTATNPLMVYLYLKLYANANASLIVGIVNTLYSLGFLGIIFFFSDLLKYENWFGLSISILSLVIALVFFIANSIDLKKYELSKGWLRVRSIGYTLIAIGTFLFPNVLTGFLIGAVGFFSIAFGLYCTFRRYNNALIRIFGIACLAIGILLNVLPSFSIHYYHIFVISLIGLRGIVQIILALIYKRIDHLYRKEEEGFTDYVIE